MPRSRVKAVGILVGGYTKIWGVNTKKLKIPEGSW